MIIIIGAGIAGLSLGWELVKLRQKVTIVESGTVARGASGVATSYLEARLGNTAMRRLERASLALWQNWATELEKQTGHSVDFRADGQLRVSLSENERQFEKDLRTRTAENNPFELLSSDDLVRLEPALSSRISKAAFLPDVCRVDGQKICAALAHAIVEAGGTIQTHWHASHIDTFPGLVELRSDDGQIIQGDVVVLANGLGANKIAGLPDDMPQSRCVRGVNLIIDQSSLTQPIRHLVKHHRGNLCPRSDNKLIVGTTYEAGETSLTVDHSVIDKLYANAEPILPRLREFPLSNVICGQRAKIGDGNLRLGRLSDQQRIVLSLSHAGAGFLRAPLIAQELAHYVLNDEWGEFTSPLFG